MLGKCIIWVIVASFSSEFVSAATDKIFCYHGTWSKYRTGNGTFAVSNIDPSLCTHLIYSFVGLSTANNGTVVSLDSYLDITLGNLAAFNALKTQNPKLKTLLAIGGWNEGSLKYSTVAASATLRQEFISSALSWVQTYGFDGFDLDWEYPAQRGGSSSDVENFGTLCAEFRKVFDQHNLILSAAVAATATSIATSYNVTTISKYLDFINIMAYDLHASWDGVTGHNAPLYASSIDTTASSLNLNVAAVVQAWITNGADPQKLVLGLPMYGRSFTLSNTSNVALGAATSGAGVAGPYTAEAGMLGYNEIVEKQAAGGWTVVWDDQQKVPHMYNGDQWVGFDDPTAIKLKVKHAIAANLAGVMIWSIETDDFLGISGKKFALLTAINEALSTNSSASNSTTTITTATTTTTSTTAATTSTAAANTSTTAATTSTAAANISTTAATTSTAAANTSTTAATTSTAAANTSTTAATTSTAAANTTTTAATTSTTAATLTTSSNGTTVAASVSSNTTTTALSNSTSSLCKAVGYARHPTNCTIFFNCQLVNGNYIATPRTCSSGLYFDTTINVCNWPSAVTGC